MISHYCGEGLILNKSARKYSEACKRFQSIGKKESDKTWPGLGSENHRNNKKESSDNSQGMGKTLPLYREELRVSGMREA